jgi:sterol desaturase/sphingolipid hydroxylase (fatty acid hydroxylase superfamily)
VVQFLDLASNILAIWLVSLTIHLIVYFAFTATLVYAYRFFWEKGLAKYKIQEREASSADIRREIRSSLCGMLISSMVFAGVYFGWRAGIFTIYLGIAPLGWSYMLFSIAAAMVANDTYFYWTHRLLHVRPFVRFHRTHHRSITPTAYSVFAFDFTEAALLSLFLPFWLLIVPMQLPAVSIYLTFMVTQITLGHSGVELFNHGAGRSKWFGWLFTITHHDLHHSTFRYNFGLYFSWWDRLMGTEHPSACEPGKTRWSTSTAKRLDALTVQAAATERGRQSLSKP